MRNRKLNSPGCSRFGRRNSRSMLLFAFNGSGAEYPFGDSLRNAEPRSVNGYWRLNPPPYRNWRSSEESRCIGHLRPRSNLNQKPRNREPLIFQNRQEIESWDLQHIYGNKTMQAEQYPKPVREEDQWGVTETKDTSSSMLFYTIFGGSEAKTRGNGRLCQTQIEETPMLSISPPPHFHFKFIALLY